MKTVYIPKGETVTYETLVTDNLVVRGCLIVENGVKANRISGSGVISAGEISADVIQARELEAAMIVCRRLLAQRVSAPEVFASDSITASRYLSATYVETGRLTVSLSEISEVKAEEVVNLPSKKRSMLATLLASSLRAFWLALTARTEKKPLKEAAESAAEAVQGENVSGMEPGLKAEIAKAVQDILNQEKPNVRDDHTDAEEDFELKRLTSLYRLCRDSGYTLRLVPGTPEENAPVFDFETAKIVRPAA